MPAPTAVALFYAVVAWLACWDVDLIVIVARGPILIDPILKVIIVTICLIIVLMAGYRSDWMLHS